MTREELFDQMRIYAKKNWVPILRKDTEEFLRNFIKEKQPKSILELGTAIGFSSLVFYDTLNGNVVIDTIEKDEERIKEAQKNINTFFDIFQSDSSDTENSNLSISQITIFKGDALKIIKTITQPYDFIFIDANKSKILDYLHEAVRLSHKGTYIIIDNLSLDGATFEDFYPDHKHRTVIFRLREFVKFMGINPNDSNPILKIIDKRETETIYYKIGDGFSVTEIK